MDFEPHSLWLWLPLALLGGGLGAILRLLIVDAATRGLGTAWPWGTWSVNILGCVAAGLSLALLNGLPALPGQWLVLFWLGGVLGSLTTVSAFSLQTLQLALTRGAPAALTNLLVTVPACLLGVMLGWWLGGALL